jgi:6-phosphogluconolactonase
VNLWSVDDLVVTAADLLAGALREGTRGGREFALALSGGRAPWEVFARLADSPDIAWPRVHIYQVDERVAPVGDQDRNLTHLEKNLTSKVPAVLHRLPVDEPDLDDACARYGAELPEELDLIHLGLGADGHTASLVPGDGVLDVRDRDVARTALYQGRRRMTLTFPAINRARSILWIVSGDDKATALAQLVSGDPAIPATGIARHHALLLTDLQLPSGELQ